MPGPKHDLDPMLSCTSPLPPPPPPPCWT